MFIFSKYKQSTYLNFKNLNQKSNIKNSKIINYNNIDYIFPYKSNFIRNFIYFYSLFLISNSFSLYNQKNNPTFKINFNFENILLLNDDYSNFY
jgi:hypothetical protein